MRRCRPIAAFVVVLTIALSMSSDATRIETTAAQTQTGPVDLAAITIRPSDPSQAGWLHQGAYVPSVQAQARAFSDYFGRGTAQDEVAERLTGMG